MTPRSAAEAMREAAAQVAEEVGNNDPRFTAEGVRLTAGSIRALPLPPEPAQAPDEGAQDTERFLSLKDVADQFAGMLPTKHYRAAMANLAALNKRDGG